MICFDYRPGRLLGRHTANTLFSASDNKDVPAKTSRRNLYGHAASLTCFCNILRDLLLVTGTLACFYNERNFQSVNSSRDLAKNILWQAGNRSD